MIRISIEPTFEAWRAAARPLLQAGTAPAHVVFENARAGQGSLWGAQASPAPAQNGTLTLPREFFTDATKAAFHRDPERFSLLYRVAYRILQGERSLLAIASDPDVSLLRRMAQGVRRDLHHMHAFVRFRRVEGDGPEQFVAWHEPEHPILRLAAPFFRERFAAMRWSILTPDESVSWTGAELVWGPGAPRSAAPTSDELEELFASYYRAIFNPARVNLKVMRGHMPVRHWATLPETRALTELVKTAPEQLRAMRTPNASAAESFVPRGASIETLRVAARDCTACPLHERATQTVFGEGPSAAALMLVGEQPGDEEDRSGRPFVGPAGKVLDDALSAAELPRSELYLTNAVKHFRFRDAGPRRLHDKPRPGDVRACRAWLDAEIASIKPRAIVCLGLTAAQSFVGSRFSAGRYRGKWFETPWSRYWMVTYHPAAILRMPDPASQRQAFDELVEHLRRARAVLHAETLAQPLTAP